MQKDIRNQGLAVILASNPRNPTGQVNLDSSFRDANFAYDFNFSPGDQVRGTVMVRVPSRPDSLRGNDLKELVSLSREGTTVILDEVRPLINIYASVLLTHS